MSERPDYARSRVILVGTAIYADKEYPPLPAAANSLTAMRHMLTSSDLCGWPPDRITVLEDPAEVPQTLQTLRRLVRDTDDILLVYFVGHGVILRRGQLSLVLANTDAQDPDYTGLRYQDVRELLLDSSARMKIVILDCCYSGRAIEALSSTDVADSTDTHGVYTLTASDHTAHVVPLTRQLNSTTSFTGELVDLVRDGISGESEQLSLGTLYLHLRRRLQRRGLPLPNRRGTDTADQFLFTRNAAYQREPVVEREGAFDDGVSAITAPVVDPTKPPGTRPGVRYRIAALAIAAGIVVAASVWVVWGRPDGIGHAGSTPSQSSSTPTTAPSTPLAGSPTFSTMQNRGRVIIGVKEDQPGMGFRDVTTGTYSGFDIEIAKLVAAKLGFAEPQLTFKTIPSAQREQAINEGTVDYYVGTYTINEQRKEKVSFAGPYYLAGQDLLVRKDDTSITGQNTLKGKKVCSVTGSLPLVLARGAELTEPNNFVETQSYAQCVERLIANQVDTLTTDDAILRGYAAQSPDQLRVVGRPFSEEPYGIGLLKTDDVLRHAMNDILQTALDDGTWDAIYSRTLGRSGSSPRKPTIQR